MRLITDENISWRLKKIIPQWDILPANEINRAIRLTDLSIWNFAKENNYTILTFDEDFSELQNLFSYPPKIIWLRTGNVRTAEVATLLLKFKSKIDEFLLDDTLGVYEIYL
jgi:predicted nuclease of predicted toxin-antitoxin system